MLTLFYITNDREIASIAEKNGIDRIWIDLETLGKNERQKNMNTVKSNHSVSDIPKVKSVLTKSELLVRVNPWNEGSRREIDAVVNSGADMIMLPMWKSVSDVKNFLDCVNGRTKTTLLLETKEAVDCIDEVLALDFDEIHIGLNDLHLSYGMDFLFEPLATGLVDNLCMKFKKRGIPYGFGGIAKLGGGLIPSENIIMEHYRLGSTRTILSRSFCDVKNIGDISKIESSFEENMKLIREFEHICESADSVTLEENHRKVIGLVNAVTHEIREKYNA